MDQSQPLPTRSRNGRDSDRLHFIHFRSTIVVHEESIEESRGSLAADYGDIRRGKR